MRERVENWLNASTAFDIQPFKTYIDRTYKNNRRRPGFYGWKGLHYFLYEYEMEKVREKGNPKINWELFIKSEKDKVSIEHIFPQTPEDIYWQNQFSQYNEHEKRILAHSLGNLLPLSQSKNASLQNVSFPEKKQPTQVARSGYVDGSHNEIEVAAYSDWNASSILDRGFKLLEFMERRWELKFANRQEMQRLLFLGFLD